MLGSLHNGAVFAGAQALPSVAFDGADDFVELPPTTFVAGPFSLSVWVRHEHQIGGGAGDFGPILALTDDEGADDEAAQNVIQLQVSEDSPLRSKLQKTPSQKRLHNHVCLDEVVDVLHHAVELLLRLREPELRVVLATAGGAATAARGSAR